MRVAIQEVFHDLGGDLIIAPLNVSAGENLV